MVWDDSITRLFVLPTGNRPLGLLFRANKGQVDLEGVIGEQWGCCVHAPGVGGAPPFVSCACRGHHSLQPLQPAQQLRAPVDVV